MKPYLTFLVVLFTWTANAQIQVGSNEIASMNRAGNISATDLAALQKTTTLFTLQYKDYAEQEQYEKAIRSVWKVTPFKIIKPDELNDYLQKGGYSVFSFGGYMVQRQGTSSGTSNMHVTYDLWLPDIKKSGKIKEQFFARVMLYPDNKTFFTAMRNSNRRNSVFSEKMTSFLYNDAIIYSWGPGFLKGYLKTINDCLLRKDERGPFSEEDDKAALASLASQTLYVPDYVNVRFNMLSGAEKVDAAKAEKDFKDAYPFPIKIVPAATLNQMILDETKPVKYLVYIKSSTDKFIDVFDSGNGKLIYAQYVKLSYNFQDKDLHKLAKSVK